MRSPLPASPRHLWTIKGGSCHVLGARLYLPRGSLVVLPIDQKFAPHFETGRLCHDVGLLKDFLYSICSTTRTSDLAELLKITRTPRRCWMELRSGLRQEGHALPLPHQGRGTCGQTFQWRPLHAFTFGGDGLISCKCHLARR